MSNDAVSYRKPCIALMGEFSAGKSTLANLLIGQNLLPVQIVATQLPPVIVSFGDDAPFCVDFDGQKHPIDLHDLAAVSLDRFTHIQIFSTEDLLRQCDLIDMPGISDPNVSSEVWERMIDRADGVLWCSHATQAWRQSEAAVWAELPETLYQRSLLLLTRADKLCSQADRERVLRRVQKETAGLFRACLPISLLLAMQEHEDHDLWEQSGAGDFVKHLVSLIRDLSVEIGGNARQDLSHAGLRLPAFEGPAQLDVAGSGPHLARAPVDAVRVVPRRIVRGNEETPRPSARPS
jgi:hypothetical protein